MATNVSATVYGKLGQGDGLDQMAAWSRRRCVHDQRRDYQWTQNGVQHLDATVSATDSHQIQLVEQHTDKDIQASLFQTQQITRHTIAFSWLRRMC